MILLTKGKFAHYFKIRIKITNENVGIKRESVHQAKFRY